MVRHFGKPTKHSSKLNRWCNALELYGRGSLGLDSWIWWECCHSFYSLCYCCEGPNVWILQRFSLRIYIVRKCPTMHVAWESSPIFLILRFMFATCPVPCEVWEWWVAGDLWAAMPSLIRCWGICWALARAIGCAYQRCFWSTWVVRAESTAGHALNDLFSHVLTYIVILNCFRLRFNSFVMYGCCLTFLHSCCYFVM